MTKERGGGSTNGHFKFTPKLSFHLEIAGVKISVQNTWVMTKLKQ